MNFNCEICNESFQSSNKRSRFCSYECRLENQNINYVSKTKIKGQNSKRNCEICNKLYVLKASNQKYCSPPCQLVAQKKSWARDGLVQDVLIKGELYTDKIKKKYKIDSKLTCPNCSKSFLKKHKDQKFCTEKCRYKHHKKDLRIKYKPIDFEKNKNCEVCKKPFKTDAINQIYCSEKCKKQGSKVKTKLKNKEYSLIANKKKHEELYAYKSKSSKYFTIFNNLRFYTEHDFEEWFKNNYSIFGIKEIIKINRWYPDVVARMHNNKIIRIELELLARNFIDHGHEPSMCDLIICFAKRKSEQTIKGVPVISIFETTMLSGSNFNNYNEDKLALSEFMKNLIENFHKNVDEFLEASNVEYPDEEYVMAQISRTKDLD